MSSRNANERLLLVVSIAVFLDTLFYAVITPLLPELSHQLHLSKLSAGVMTASYPAGMLIASLPGGALAVRRGPRFTVITGLVLLVISTVAFGLLRTAPGLDVARFVEGIGGACSWAGGLAWIVAATPRDRRGSVMGKALGTSIAGSLFGPAIGALASATGRAGLFCGLAAVASLLLIPVTRLEDESELSDQPVVEVVRVLRRPALAGAMWLMVLPALVSGALNVLGPLRLHRFGAGAGIIGATFVLSAALETVMSPVAGHFSDRHGRTLPLRGGLIGLAAALACFTLPSDAVLLGLVMVATAAILGIFWAPVMALLSDLAEAHRIDQGHAAALMNLAWAAGQIIGSGGGGAVGKAFGDGAPMLTVAVLCLVTLVALRGGRVAHSAAAS
ncbi:MAG TPA: MFS transporter [Solirubrobacteraceae bacterium]|jgi:MFS family permease|nr:MFS transporter [Solirubrobacteraceae bacterium]